MFNLCHEFLPKYVQLKGGCLMRKKVKFLWVLAGVLFIGSILFLCFNNTKYGIVGLIMCVIAMAVCSKIQRYSLKEEVLKNCKAKETELKLIEKFTLQENEFKKREEINRKKSREEMQQFYSKISHSIRIPISIISGYADLLTGDFEINEEVRREYLKKVCDRVTYMNEVLSLLLMEGRNEGQGAEMSLEKVDILKMIQKIASDISMATKEMDVIIKVVSNEDSIIINADVMQLTKAFYNIIENSLKYMGRRGTITITVSDFEEEVLLIFRDNGLGLAQEETDNIFNLNFQGSNKKAGNGLGLYMTKMIVTAHEGEIFAKSDVDKGMAIHINLPKKPSKGKFLAENSNSEFLMNL